MFELKLKTHDSLAVEFREQFNEALGSYVISDDGNPADPAEIFNQACRDLENQNFDKTTQEHLHLASEVAAVQSYLAEQHAAGNDFATEIISKIDPQHLKSDTGLNL